MLSEALMKRHLTAFFGGLGLSVLAGFGIHAARNRREIAQRGKELAERGRERGRVLVGRGRDLARRGQQFANAVRIPGDVDLNQCSAEQLTSIGIDHTTAQRILESRPYRSKLELVSRVMLTPDVYGAIKHRVFVSGTDDAVKVAS
jgi:hypothetical protein